MKKIMDVCATIKAFRACNTHILMFAMVCLWVSNTLHAESLAWIEPKDPLHKAVMNGDIQAAKLLINNGYDIEIANGPFRSPLDRAVAMNNVEMARFLLLHGASLDKLTKGHESLAAQAMADDHYEMAEMLSYHAQPAQHLAYANLLASCCAVLVSIAAYRRKKAPHAEKAQHKNTGRNLRRELRLKPGNDKVYHVTHSSKAHIKYKSLALDKSENGLRLICMGSEIPVMHEVLIIHSNTMSETNYYEVKWSQKMGVHANIFMFGVQRKDMNSTQVQQPSVKVAA